MNKLVWDNGPRRPIEGVVLEGPCREGWEWDQFYVYCELDVGDGHTKHRWTYKDDYKGLNVVVEWESYWQEELPNTEWPCPDCEHMHKGKDESAENPAYWLNGSCKKLVPHSLSGGLAHCTCLRRRPDKP